MADDHKYVIYRPEMQKNPKGNGNNMKVNNYEIKLFYSNLAVRDLTELCDGIKNIGSLFHDENGNALDVAEEYANIIKLIRILANAAITRDNREIELGMREGNKKEKYTDEVLEEILDMAKAPDYLTEVLDVMGLASKFEIPDGVKMTSPDIDLEEIEAERNP